MDDRSMESSDPRELWLPVILLPCLALIGELGDWLPVLLPLCLALSGDCGAWLVNTASHSESWLRSRSWPKWPEPVIRLTSMFSRLVFTWNVSIESLLSERVSGRLSWKASALVTRRVSGCVSGRLSFVGLDLESFDLIFLLFTLSSLSLSSTSSFSRSNHSSSEVHNNSRGYRQTNRHKTLH